jgi:hypothetical protein
LISQVTRVLSDLFKPIAASRSKTTQSAQSDADRDATGNSYENLHQQQEKQEEAPHSEAQLETSEKPTAQVIPISGNTPEEMLANRKKAIGISQAWIGLVTTLQKQNSEKVEQSAAAGSGAYEKANTGTSKASRAKLGVIVDKKVA